MKLIPAAITIVTSLTIAVILMALFVFPSAPKTSPTLIMFHNPKCMYCQKFLDEVCLTKEGDADRDRTCPGYGWKQDPKFEKYPIVIVMKKNSLDWVNRAFKDGIIETIIGTPTFILWDGEREVGRIVGFSSKEEFYEELEELIKLDRPQKTFYRVN